MALNFGAKLVKIQFSTVGEIMIDDLPFSFGIESIGRESKKGLGISVAGEGVESGEVTFDNLEYHEMHGGNVTVVKMPIRLETKKDGKPVYKAKFTKIPLTEFSTGSFFKKVDEQSVMDRLNAEIAFKITPHYKGEGSPEILLSVYPLENPLGLCSQWLNVTSDQDYFLHKFKKGAKRR